MVISVDIGLGLLPHIIIRILYCADFIDLCLSIAIELFRHCSQWYWFSLSASPRTIFFQSHDRKQFFSYKRSACRCIDLINTLADPFWQRKKTVAALNFILELESRRQTQTRNRRRKKKKKKSNQEEVGKSSNKLKPSGYASMDNLPMVWIDFYWFLPVWPKTLGLGVLVVCVRMCDFDITDFDITCQTDSLFSRTAFTLFESLCRFIHFVSQFQWHIWNATSIDFCRFLFCLNFYTHVLFYPSNAHDAQLENETKTDVICRHTRAQAQSHSETREHFFTRDLPIFYFANQVDRVKCDVELVWVRFKWWLRIRSICVLSLSSSLCLKTNQIRKSLFRLRNLVIYCIALPCLYKSQ